MQTNGGPAAPALVARALHLAHAVHALEQVRPGGADDAIVALSAELVDVLGRVAIESRSRQATDSIELRDDGHFAAGGDGGDDQ